MTTAFKTACVNARSTHFASREAAEAEVLERKINEASSRRSGGRVRHVEQCPTCHMWMIVSPSQRQHRQNGAPSQRRR